MTVTSPNIRCQKCKAVLSPHWTHCRICKTRLSTSTSHPPTPACCRLRPGDLIVYKHGDTLHDGALQQVTMTEGHLTCQLTSGQTIPGRSIRAVGIRQSDGTLTEAFSVRTEEQLLITPVTTPIAPPAEPSSTKPSRSPWYLHWKDIADMTMGILPHEPRVPMITSMLTRCEAAYRKGDETGFMKLKDQLRNLIQASNPKPTKAKG